MPAPQFGEPEPGRDYRDRPAAFGIAEREGRIALVRVEKPGHAAWLDLPGGAIDPGEDEAQAVVREFGEETGLKVQAGEVYARADQRFINTDGEAFNNRAGFLVLTLLGEDPALKVEDDHTLVWLPATEALVRLRHEAHAWAVTAWLRLPR
jgi:8-oxo-dGTP diphosphatase